MSSLARPCSDESLKTVLKHILDETENALATLTMKTTLKLAEEKLSLENGTLCGKTSEHNEWADHILYQLLAEKVEANPALAEANPQPAAIRKPLAPYFLWLSENRATIVSSLGNQAKGSDITKKAGELWAALSEDAKEEYKRKSKKSKEDYETSLKKDPPKKEVPKKRKKGSSYTFFVKENRASIAAGNPSLSFGELSKKVGEIWKGMSSEEKEKYEKMAVDTIDEEVDDEVAAPAAKRQRKPAAKKSGKDEKPEESAPSKPSPKKPAPKKLTEKREEKQKSKVEEPVDAPEEKKAKRKPAPKKAPKTSPKEGASKATN